MAPRPAGMWPPGSRHPGRATLPWPPRKHRLLGERSTVEAGEGDRSPQSQVGHQRPGADSANFQTLGAQYTASYALWVPGPKPQARRRVRLPSEGSRWRTPSLPLPAPAVALGLRTRPSSPRGPGYKGSYRTCLSLCMTPVTGSGRSQPNTTSSQPYHVRKGPTSK